MDVEVGYLSSSRSQDLGDIAPFRVRVRIRVRVRVRVRFLQISRSVRYCTRTPALHGAELLLLLPKFTLLLLLLLSLSLLVVVAVVVAVERPVVGRSVESGAG